jgi:hypothetical protein
MPEVMPEVMVEVMAEVEADESGSKRQENARPTLRFPL